MTTTTAEIHDRVSRTRMTFTDHGDHLVVDMWLEPGGGLPAHFHPVQEERWSVVAGEAKVRHRDTERVVRPEDGEVVVKPHDVHGITSCSDQEAHMRCVVTPPLRLQQFLEEASQAAEQGLFTKRGLPSGLKGARWAAAFLKRYEDETVMLSPPRFVQKALIKLLA